jgi:F-type H+-transporting ATPase subunit delta
MAEMRVAKRYARALFNTAKKEGVVASISDDLNAITTAIRNSDGFRTFLYNPQTESSDKIALFGKVFGDKITATTMAFMRLLVAKGRDGEIFGVKVAYDELRRQDESVVRAIIESSTPLDDNQKTAIINKIEAETGNKLEPEFTVNPDLIMGVKVTYGDYVLDGSIRGQLNRMKEKLVYDLLKQA